LGKLAKWTIDKNEEQQVLADLLEYCKQDTRAMVAIYKKLQGKKQKSCINTNKW
jgi:uncharacterized protein YprB with RNaseH-like and TPR domain